MENIFKSIPRSFPVNINISEKLFLTMEQTRKWNAKFMCRLINTLYVSELFFGDQIYTDISGKTHDRAGNFSNEALQFNNGAAPSQISFSRCRISTDKD